MNQDSFWGGFFLGIFMAVSLILVVFGGIKTFKDQERLEYLKEYLINDGKCIINDNVKFTIQRYAGKLDNGKIICKTNTGELKLLRYDLE